MITDPERTNLIRYFTNLGQSHSALWKYESHILPAPGSNAYLLKLQLGDQALIKAWNKESPIDQLQSKWKDLFSIVLTTPSAIKIVGIDSWHHLSKV